MQPQPQRVEELIGAAGMSATAAMTNLLLSSSTSVKTAPEVFSVLYNWATASLDLYKTELVAVLYPLFVHCYLEMISCGLRDEAQKFLEKYRYSHQERHADEIKTLASIITAEHVEVNSLAQLYRKNKFTVTMSSFSYQLLLNFLSDSRYIFLLSIVNKYLNIEVFKGQPIETLGGGKYGISGLKEEDEETIRKAELYQDVSISWMDEQVKKKKKSDRDDKQARDTVAFPVLTEEQQAIVREDVKKQLHVAANALPSVCMFTVLNSNHSAQCMDISHDASLVSIGMSNSSIRVFKMDDGIGSDPSSSNVEQDHTFKADYIKLIGHAGPVYGTAISFDKEFVLGCGADHTARLFSLSTQSNVVVYKGHNFPIWDVTFAPFGYYFATASNDRTARLWSTDHIFPLRIFAGHLSDVDCVAFHPNSNYLATGSSDKSIRLWDIQTGKCVRYFAGHTGPIQCIRLSPCGKYLASGSADETVRLWDLNTAKQIDCGYGHSGPIWSLDFSRESSMLASGSEDSTVKLWSVKSTAVSDDVDGNTSAAAATTSNSSSSADSFLMKTFYTKETPVHSLRFTYRNLLLAAGPYSPSPVDINL